MNNKIKTTTQLGREAIMKFNDEIVFPVRRLMRGEISLSPLTNCCVKRAKHPIPEVNELRRRGYEVTFACLENDILGVLGPEECDGPIPFHCDIPWS